MGERGPIAPLILVHGGAGVVKDDQAAEKLVLGVKQAVRAGHAKFEATGSMLDAIEASIRYMEDNEVFNAGKGSVINTDGEVEMDASVMVGSSLAAGAVTIVKDVKNPISLARLVMEKTEHVLLGAEGAKRFAIEQGVEMVEPGALLTEKRVNDLKRIKEGLKKPVDDLGTVGAVGVDSHGHVFAATSTGGREGKLPGRCSDTSILGAGTYANDEIGAVSTTGHGESIMRLCVAYEILNEIKNGAAPQDATQGSCDRVKEKLGQTCGAITVTKDGEVGVGFSSNRMSWAYNKGKTLYYGIDHGDCRSENL